MKLLYKNHFFPLLAALLIAMAMSSCETDDDEFDHDIPAGQGTLVVNNNTDNDIHVYINSIEYNETDHNDYEFYDRDPGTYRVVLDEDDGDRSWYDDVDVLEGKKTILDVYDSGYIYNYDVYKRIDD